MPKHTKGLYWVCDIDKYADLWDIWRDKNVASIGWPKLTKGGRRRITTIRKCTRGDRVVAYLKHGRIGGIGTLTGRDGLDNYRALIKEDNEQGRIVGVKWDILPKKGCYALAPEEVGPPIRSTLKNLNPQEIDRLGDVVGNPDSWEPLATSKDLVYDEKSELHPLITKNLSSLERGLKLYDAGMPTEYPANPIGKIDILAQDSEGRPVAIEAKPHHVDDAVVGQIARYIGWLKKKLNREDARGIIVAGEFSPKTRYAALAVQGLSLVRYAVRDKKISFKRVKL